jgi:hypothetical protein
MPEPVEPSQAVKLSEFLSPKPVVGAGACSAMVLAFTTSLCSSFPVLPSAIVALSLSAIFAVLMVTASNGQKLSIKTLYGLICTLMIFSAARGGNTTVVEAMPNPIPNAPDQIIKMAKVDWSFIPSALAANDVNKIFYLAYVTNNLPVYTNAAGHSFTNTEFKAQSQKSLFRKWRWTND